MLNFRGHRTCTIANSLLTSTVSRWVAYVSFYEVHPCRAWYGGQTEVWCSNQTITGSHYVFLSSIISRVAYCEAEVDFGRVIGKQTVLVVSKLSHFSN